MIKCAKFLWSLEIYTLKNTAQNFKHLELSEIIKFHFVFDSFKIQPIYDDIFEAIKCEILYKFSELENKFIFNTKFNAEISNALYHLSKNNRLKSQIYAKISRKNVAEIYAQLVNSGILFVEKNQFAPISNKNLQEKLHFNSNFIRFWFRFIYPNQKLIKMRKFELLLSVIKDDFDNYASICFENLSKELIANRLKIPPFEITSYWDENNEIDIFIKNSNHFIVGEVKYKNKKICKNVLNLLLLKCEKIGICAHKIVLISKSGFSNEMLKIKNDKIVLFSLNDFKEII